MKTLTMLTIYTADLLAALFLLYILINIFVFLGQVLGGFHPRDIIEKKAYDRLVFEKADTAEEVAIWVDRGSSPLDIATLLGGRKILLGILVLLAANHLKKTSPP